MKIAITGHTKGIGKATIDLLTSNGYEVIGFSRQNGWDFNDPSTRKDFISELKKGNYDCFINNAYPHKYYQNMEGFFQVELLNQAWLLWEKDSSKTIIVIGSNNADNGKNYFHPFSIHKRALDETCKQLRNTRSWPHIINIKPSYVDTQVISHLNNVSKSSPDQVAELILWTIANPVKIFDLSFGAFEVK
jgi:NADP-dependent 3-hydroxy acid dehydrogenase YdfG